jgi:seryl-tRNA synthetase
MLDINFIRQNPDKVKEGCQKKQVKVDIDKLLELDKKRREMLQTFESLKAEQNKISRQKTQTKEQIEKAREIKEKIKKITPELKEIEKEFNDLMLQVPNLPQEDVPVGKDETDNVVVKEVGEKPKFDFKVKDHLEIGENLDIIDVKRASKISGTRFGFFKKEATLLEFALINFTYDILLKKGFIPVIPPVMLKPEMLEGSGHLSEKDRPERYFIEKDNLYLAGTAEQPIAAMHTNEVFKEKDLPLRYLGFSSCFRREAGSYGKDTRGIFRVHQFDKIEMFSYCHPEKSREEHQFLLSCQEEIMQKLNISYRVMAICTGDLGFPAAAAYDVEAWLPGQNCYRETHTTFNDTDFQTRRLNVRYQDQKTKNLEFTHALNGTALAIGRALIAIIENYQGKDGSIRVPKVLQKYLKFKIIK